MKIKNTVKKHIFGNKKFQPFFFRLFHISLEGLNIGTGGRHPNANGENWAIKYILKKIKEEREIIIFDCGAQIGNYTKEVLKISKKEKVSVKIHGFEPAKKEYFEYSKLATKNKNIFPHNLALGDENGSAILYIPKETTGLSSLYEKPEVETDKKEVRISTITDFCVENKISHIHFLKMDVEGNENKVLLGAVDLINNNKIDFIQFEFGIYSLYAKTSFREIFNLLKNNYSIFRILRNNLEEIKKPGRIEEMFFTTNYLCVRKKL